MKGENDQRMWDGHPVETNIDIDFLDRPISIPKGTRGTIVRGAAEEGGAIVRFPGFGQLGVPTRCLDFFIGWPRS